MKHEQFDFLEAHVYITHLNATKSTNSQKDLYRYMYKYMQIIEVLLDQLIIAWMTS